MCVLDRTVKPIFRFWLKTFDSPWHRELGGVWGLGTLVFVSNAVWCIMKMNGTEGQTGQPPERFYCL